METIKKRYFLVKAKSWTQTQTLIKYQHQQLSSMAYVITLDWQITIRFYGAFLWVWFSLYTHFYLILPLLPTCSIDRLSNRVQLTKHHFIPKSNRVGCLPNELRQYGRKLFIESLTYTRTKKKLQEVKKPQGALTTPIISKSETKTNITVKFNVNSSEIWCDLI